MAENWFQGPEYQNYWQHLNRIQKQTEDQAKLCEQNSAAYWRSVAFGLQYENEMLHQLVQQLLGVRMPNDSDPNLEPSPQQKTRNSKKNKTVVVEDCDTGDTVASDSLEEYLKFVEETENFRVRRDEEKKNEDGYQSKLSPDEDIVNDSATAKCCISISNSPSSKVVETVNIQEEEKVNKERKPLSIKKRLLEKDTKFRVFQKEALIFPKEFELAGTDEDKENRL